jgi:VanZ family protein
LILGVLISSGIGRLAVRSKIGTFLFFFAIGTSIAALDEVLQSYVPGRRMDVFDWIADTLGVVLGVGLCVSRNIGIKKPKPVFFDAEAKGEEGDVG